jgi:hypothetical protein
LHGGKRLGAGRPAGSLNKANCTDKMRISDFAKQFSEEAVLALAEISKSGVSESSRIAASVALLDRAYGKPALASTEVHGNLPPIIIQRADQ